MAEAYDFRRAGALLRDAIGAVGLKGFIAAPVLLPIMEDFPERFYTTSDGVALVAGQLLEGPELEIESGGRMPSAGVFPGTVQCTENGKPYVLSVDAGTVGGYPRVAQVVRGDRHMLGQLRPGDHVRFLPRDGEAARTDLFAKLNYWGRWVGDIEKVI